jgi:hypothetical protein
MRLSNVRFLLLAFLSLWVNSSSRADDQPGYGRGFAPPAPQGMPSANQPFASSGLGRPLATTTSFVQPDSISRSQSRLPDAMWEEPIALPVAFDSIATEPSAGSFAMRVSQVDLHASEEILPSPQHPPESTPSGQPVNGTWRDEGDFVVIEVNGQQLRLAKSALAPPQPTAGSSVRVATGSVHGRLLQGGRPLVNCSVVIVPMHKDGATDDTGVRQPISTVTDADGVYGFENVPVGSYKLTWLPAGTQQWIRRIEMKPDVFIHEGQDVTLKDIRSAMRTIN